MAPMAPLGRTQAIRYVREGKLPVWVGSPHPHVMIVEQDGRFRIRKLEVAEADVRAEQAKGGGFTPEQYYGLGKPTGEIFVDAATRDELLDRMATMPWPNDW